VSRRPTNVPLTVKEFDEERCGVCGGCGCACGYIAYLKGGKLVDLYGHPHDPNGIGSLCTKGITLIQEAPLNPLRLTRPLLKEGEGFRVVSVEEAKGWLRANLKGRIGVFLSRSEDLRTYALARGITDHVYSDSVYLPFRASTLRPQRWRDQRIILALELHSVFSEVMSTRWLVDASERSSYIVSVSSRFETISSKATERLLLKPPHVVRFLEELADKLEGKHREYMFEGWVERLSRAFSLVKDSLILIGDTLLRTPWRGNVLDSLRRIRRRLRVNYSIVGDVSPLPTREIRDLREDLKELDTLIFFGNPGMYMSDATLKELSRKKVVSFQVFPNLTAHLSHLVFPSVLFAEREYIGYRNGFGFLSYSPKVLQEPEGVLPPEELLSIRPNVEAYLSQLGIAVPELEESEGGVDVKMPTVEEWDGEVERAPLEDGFYLVCDNTLVDEMGHWNPWTHEMEREQFAYMSEKTARDLEVKEEIELRGVRLKVKINNNVAEGVVFVPNSFEETQPFDPGVRAGRIIEEGYRVERLRLK